MTEQEQPKNDFMHKLALQIVERRNLVFLIVILGTIFTIFSRSWVKVESDLTTYLPKTSETRMGLDIMEKEFTTYGSADVMVANITPDEADRLNDELAGLRGIQMIEYDDTTAHYNNVSALYSITFDYPEDDDQCLETLESVKEYLKDYDIYVSTSLGNTQEETIEREVNVIMVYVAIIIVVVLIFTSQTYAEVPVLLLTFVVGMILNMGTNFLLGTISFVSNSVTNILQLALSLDYAIIFCNHFKEEHETLPLKEAVIESLAKSIPEISSSSLTTIGGLVAMLFIFHRRFFRHAAAASPYKHRTLRSETSAGCPSWVHRQNSGSIFAASFTSQFWRRTCRRFWRRRITCQFCQLFQCGRAMVCTQFLGFRNFIHDCIVVLQ